MARTKKQKRDYLKKYQLLDIELLKINAENLKTENDKEEVFRLSKEFGYEITELNEKEVIINLKAVIKLEPRTPFIMELELIIKYKVLESTSKEDVEENIEDLLSPCGAIISFITSFISEKMVGIPMVIPPVLSIKKDK